MDQITSLYAQCSGCSLFDFNSPYPIVYIIAIRLYTNYCIRTTQTCIPHRVCASFENCCPSHYPISPGGYSEPITYNYCHVLFRHCSWLSYNLYSSLYKLWMLPLQVRGYRLPPISFLPLSLRRLALGRRRAGPSTLINSVLQSCSYAMTIVQPDKEWQHVSKPDIPAYDIFAKAIQKSQQDDREYRVIRLANGLEATLVHDGKADKAAASLDVAVGHLYDPVSLFGS